MRVEFTRTEQYENEGRGKGPIFKKGEQYDFTEDFAQRWIRRDAVIVIDPEVVVEENTYLPVGGSKAAKVDVPANFMDLRWQELQALGRQLGLAKNANKAEIHKACRAALNIE